MFMSIFSNYKCPNGLPPEECGHIPQLVANVANYFLKKQQLLKDNTKDVSRINIEQPLKRTEASLDRQKQRRRG